MGWRIEGIWLVLAVSLVTAAPAWAGSPAPQPTDPIASSPAGVMDAIPLESARQDAAPHPSSGSSPSRQRASGVFPDAVSSAGLPRLVPGGQPGSLSRSENGFGASSSIPGVGGPTRPGLGAVQGDARSAPVLGLALAILAIVIGVGVGIGGRRSSA